MIKELQLVPINNENDSREMGGALGLFANFADCEAKRERTEEAHHRILRSSASPTSSFHLQSLLMLVSFTMSRVFHCT